MYTHIFRARRPLATVIGAAAAAVALAAGISLSPGSTPEATAAPGGIVTFGDSFYANPEQIHSTLRNAPGQIGEWARDYPQTAGCLQAPDNIPNKLEQKTGHPVADWSCTAQTSRSMLNRIDRAIAAGDITNGSTVVLASGMNNYGPFGATGSVPFGFLDPATVRTDYLADMTAAGRRIRAAAPSARIIVSGALPTVDRNSAMFCAVNVVPDVPAGLPIPLLRDVESWNRDNQRTAAAQIGAQYVDIIDGARGHDTCARDADRWVAGIIDTTTPNYNMVFHPSAAGSDHVASALAAHI